MIALYVGGLVSYIFAGIIVYVKSQATLTQIPPLAAYSYSVVGILLASGLYFAVHNLYFFIGPSKKHSIRYWKAIHAIRGGLRKLSPDLKQHLILPNSMDHPHRPRLSDRWNLGVFICPLYDLLFYALFIVLFLPFFVHIDQFGCFDFTSKGDSPAVAAAVFLLPFVIGKLAIGCGTMRIYWENIDLARKMTAEDIFPRERFWVGTLTAIDKQRDDPQLDRTTLPDPRRKVVWWTHLFIWGIAVLFCIFYLYGYFPWLKAGSIFDHFKWVRLYLNLDYFSWLRIHPIKVSATLISLTLILQFVYLKTYNFPLKIRISEKGLRFRYDIVTSDVASGVDFK